MSNVPAKLPLGERQLNRAVWQLPLHRQIVSPAALLHQPLKVISLPACANKSAPIAG